MEIKCENCDYWCDHEVPESFRHDPKNEGQLFYGECRRYAPRIVLGNLVSLKRGDCDSYLSIWPWTEADIGWCGEFKPREII
jgi:hypothetical protein